MTYLQTMQLLASISVGIALQSVSWGFATLCVAEFVIALFRTFKA